MDNSITVIVGLTTFIVGLILDRFLTSYFSKKGANLATKEDVGEITKKIEEVKNMFKDQYDLSKAEKGLYGEMTKSIYEFLANIQEYEFRHGANTATKEAILADPNLKREYFKFINAANEFIGKGYVFLRDESYCHLKEAIRTEGSFADLTNNLLYAMRKSLYPETSLEPKENLKEFKL